MDNFHILTADNIGGAQEHGEAQGLCGLYSLREGIYAKALRSFYREFFQQLVKPLPVLRKVNALGRCAENRYTATIQEFCKLNSGLTAESHNYAHRLFDLDYIHYVLVGERLEIKPVRRVVIGRNGFGVVVDDYNVIPRLF